MFQPTVESTVLCTSPNCNFKAPSTNNSLMDHCRSVHQWQDVPCSYENCHFVAYNSLSFLSHKTNFHSKHRSFIPKEYPCRWAGCVSSFKDAYLLQVHMKIHTNQLYNCSYCPYRTNTDSRLRDHYRSHYQMRDFKCETCAKTFVTPTALKEHIEDVHMREQLLTCSVCTKFTGPRKRLQRHLRVVHNLLSRWNDKEKMLEMFERSY